MLPPLFESFFCAIQRADAQTSHPQGCGLPAALDEPFDDLDCDSPVILKVFEYRFTREIGDRDMQRRGVFFRSRQPKLDDGIVFGFVRQSGQRTEMAIAKKRIRLE